MDREISLSVEIAVVLIALAAFIGILWVVVDMGQDMANDASYTASDVLVSVEEGKLSELVHTHNVMPAAAVYSLLRTNGDSIPDDGVVCKIHKSKCVAKYHNNDTSRPNKMCILKHLDGRVSLEVELLDFGWYRLTIHEPDCSWFFTGCTCGS